MIAHQPFSRVLITTSDRPQDSAMLDEGTAPLGFLFQQGDSRGVVVGLLLALQATKVIAARAIVNSAVKQFVQINEAFDIAGQRCGLHGHNQLCEIFAIGRRRTLGREASDDAFDQSARKRHLFRLLSRERDEHAPARLGAYQSLGFELPQGLLQGRSADPQIPRQNAFVEAFSVRKATSQHCPSEAVMHLITKICHHDRHQWRRPSSQLRQSNFP